MPINLKYRKSPFFFFFSAPLITPIYADFPSTRVGFTCKVRAAGEAAGALSEERRGCPVPDTVGSSRLRPAPQQPHRRAQLSPSEMLVGPL